MASIRPKKDKSGRIISYEIRVFRGRDENGKQLNPHVMTWKVPENMTARQAQREAEKQKIIFENQCRMGFSLDNRQTFAEYANYVLEYKKNTGVLKHTTYSRYKSLLVRINDAIGNLKLVDVRPQHLSNLYDSLIRKSIRMNNHKAVCKVDIKEMLKEADLTQEEFLKKSGVGMSALKSCINKKAIMYDTAVKVAKTFSQSVNVMFIELDIKERLSSKSVLEHHRLIYTILRQAEIEMLIPYNPASKVIAPRAEKPEVNFYDIEQVAAISKALENEPIDRRVMIHLLLTAGIRRGELTGLCWSCVDWEHSKIHICRNVLYKADVGKYITTPKTKNSVRDITLPKEMMELLEKYYRYWCSERQKYGTKWNYFVELPDETTIRNAVDGQPPEKVSYKADFLFYQEKDGTIGYPLHPDNITSWCNDFAERNNLPHLHPHAFRHTMATILFYKGVDSISISSRLGHSKPSTTSDIYSHFIKSADNRSAECIAEVIYGADDESEDKTSAY